MSQKIKPQKYALQKTLQGKMGNKITPIMIVKWQNALGSFFNTNRNEYYKAKFISQETVRCFHFVIMSFILSLGIPIQHVHFTKSLLLHPKFCDFMGQFWARLHQVGIPLGNSPHLMSYTTHSQLQLLFFQCRIKPQGEGVLKISDN